jgi:protocatechuate 3,4-dioxygenase beta subunit
MNQENENRREFLKRAALAAAALPFLLNCRSDILAQRSDADILSVIKKNANTLPEVNWCGAIDAPSNVSWRMTLSKKSDNDEPLIISGTVFESDGATPAPNILIYFYHTDSDGFYNRKLPGEPLHGHFRGWLLTDQKGRYELSTFKPAPYPNRDNPAHIHMTLTSKTRKEESIDNIWFEGDPLITSEMKRKQMTGKGGFDPIVKLEKSAGGILRGVRNIQLWKV